MGKELVVANPVVPARHAEIDGFEMGVLDDGTPYLTSRALAKLCSVAPSVIIEMTQEWTEAKSGPRKQKIQNLLAMQGHGGDSLAIRITVEGKPTNAHPDAVCMAVLEYYAFEGPGANRERAQHNFRVLARQTLRQFIYRQVGYDPHQAVPDKWKHFHDRLIINPLPPRHFSVFREIADIIISMIQAGMTVDASVMPDISVGQAWSEEWERRNLAAKYGERRKHPHHFPDYFPQPGTVDAWVYPLDAVGEFRVWLQTEYLPNKYPNYLARKARQGALAASVVDLLVEAVVPQLPAKGREAGS